MPSHANPATGARPGRMSPIAARTGVDLAMRPARGSARASLRMACVALTVAAYGALVGPSFAQDAAPSVTEGRISVTGEGRVTVVPDMAAVSLAVVREAPNAGDALAQASAAAADVLAAMRTLGIDPRDVQTIDVSLNPVYGERDEPGDVSPIVAYRARNALSVRVRDLARLGEVIDRSVAMGANEGGGLQLTVSNADGLRGEARRLAVRDAAARAEEMAEAAGVAIGPLVELREGGARPFEPVLEARMAMADSVPIAAGETEITASVTAVYAIEE